MGLRGIFNDIFLLEQDQLKSILKIFWFIAISKSRSCLSTIVYVANLIFFIIIVYLGVKMLILDLHDHNLDRIMESLTTVWTLPCIMLKYCNLYLKRNCLWKLVQDGTLFWELGENRAELLSTVRQLARVYIMAVNLAVLSLVVLPFYSGKLHLRFYIAPGWFYMLWGLLMYLVVVAIVTLYYHHVLFCNFAANAVIQLKLVTRALKRFHLEANASVGNNASKARLKELIDYQNFLIK